jgi:hypothetical protein
MFSHEHEHNLAGTSLILQDLGPFRAALNSDVPKDCRVECVLDFFCYFFENASSFCGLLAVGVFVGNENWIYPALHSLLDHLLPGIDGVTETRAFGPVGIAQRRCQLITCPLEYVHALVIL